MKTQMLALRWFGTEKSIVTKLCLLPCLCWMALPALSSQSAPEMRCALSIGAIKEGQIQLVLAGVPGSVYQVQSTDGLSTTSIWSHVGHCVLTGTTSRVTISNCSSAVRRFYRTIWCPSTNLVWIEAGTFTMGSPADEALRSSDETQHLVTITHGFWMGKYLVTQHDYLAVSGSNPSYFTASNGYSEDLSRPVEGVSWFDAVNYCSRLTQRERAAGRIPGSYAYRLPTESEWEYACRAGTKTAFYVGNSLCSGRANFDAQKEYSSGQGETDNLKGIFLGYTVRVGTYQPNGLGLYDMDGNLWQWCQDWHADYPGGRLTDPQGPSLGLFRIWRGGTWGAFGRFCRAAQRGYFYPEFRSYSIGIRVVLSSVG